MVRSDGVLPFQRRRFSPIFREERRNLRNPAQHGYVGFKRKVYKKAKETEVFQYTDLKAMSSLSCDDFEEDCTGASSNTIALC